MKFKFSLICLILNFSFLKKKSSVHLKEEYKIIEKYHADIKFKLKKIDLKKKIYTKNDIVNNKHDCTEFVDDIIYKNVPDDDKYIDEFQNQKLIKDQIKIITYKILYTGLSRKKAMSLRYKLNYYFKQINMNYKPKIEYSGTYYNLVLDSVYNHHDGYKLLYIISLNKELKNNIPKIIKFDQYQEITKIIQNISQNNSLKTSINNLLS